jgi:uncharacterized protein (TIGR00159 family)
MCSDYQWIRNLFTVRDLIDIGLLTVIFYFFLAFLVKYRGVRLLWWVVLFITLWVLAVWFKLRTLGWLFDQIWTIFIFAIVVIFQPELRKLVQQLGGRGLFGQKYTKAKLIKKIIKAIAYLSEKQIGALIVFERNIPVSNVSEGCVPIDAIITPELLITIFYPLTPLHDGAVIIKDNRILAAACVLPLAKEVEADSKIGTRHRAAIGVSEETDAVAVVVSEETGAISVAVGGKLYKNLTEEELKELLFKELGVEEGD